MKLLSFWDCLGRPFRRQCVRYEAEGGLRDKRIGRVSNRQAPERERERTRRLYREEYADCTVTRLALQKLGDAHPAPARGQHCKKRVRCPMVGMMVLQDGSTHRWIEALGHDIDLIVTLDDAPIFVGPATSSALPMARASANPAARTPMIELAFKRLKSLLHIDNLPAWTVEASQSWLLAHLILALLVDDLSEAFLVCSPQDMNDAGYIPSLWAVQKIASLALVVAVLGPLSATKVLAAEPGVHQRIANAPRK